MGDSMPLRSMSTGRTHTICSTIAAPGPRAIPRGTTLLYDTCLGVRDQVRALEREPDRAGIERIQDGLRRNHRPRARRCSWRGQGVERRRSPDRPPRVSTPIRSRRPSISDPGSAGASIHQFSAGAARDRRPEHRPELDRPGHRDETKREIFFRRLTTSSTAVAPRFFRLRKF